MADEHPGADTDDVLAATESEHAVSSGEAADPGTRASGATIAVATAVAKFVVEEHDGSDSPNRVRDQGPCMHSGTQTCVRRQTG